MRRPVLALLCALAALGGCGGDGSESAESTTTTAPTTTSTIARGRYASPLEASNAVLTAWKNSDGDGMRRAATEEAVLVLFARTYYPHSPRGCDEPNQLGADCVFRLSGAGEVRLHATSDPAAGWIIDKVTFLD